MRVKFKGKESFDQGTIVVRSPMLGWWTASGNNLIVYPEDYLIVEDVTVVKSALDTMMDSASAPATAAMTAVQTAIMTVSVPQAFLLMKIV